MGGRGGEVTGGGVWWWLVGGGCGGCGGCGGGVGRGMVELERRGWEAGGGGEVWACAAAGCWASCKHPGMTASSHGWCASVARTGWAASWIMQAGRRSRRQASRQQVRKLQHRAAKRPTSSASVAEVWACEGSRRPRVVVAYEPRVAWFAHGDLGCLRVIQGDLRVQGDFGRLRAIQCDAVQRQSCGVGIPPPKTGFPPRRVPRRS